MSKKLADLGTGLFCVALSRSFLNKVVTSQIKDHCGIRVVMSKANPFHVGRYVKW